MKLVVDPGITRTRRPEVHDLGRCADLPRRKCERMTGIGNLRYIEAEHVRKGYPGEAFN
jgi:hypothetical protein